MKKNVDYKNEALAALKGNWSSAVLAVLVFTIVDAIVIGPNLYSSLGLVNDPTNPFLTNHQNGFSALSFILEVLVLFPLTVGLYNAFKNLLVKGDDQLVKGIFGIGFGRYRRNVAASLLKYIFTFLWTLLLIVPGIIKLLSYSMTNYILEDEPTLSPNKAIDLSREMMKGHKFDLFYLYLSFIGWGILCLFTLGIGFLWLEPYILTAQASFYQDVKGDYIARKTLAAAGAANAAAPAPVAEETTEASAEVPAIKDVRTENPEDYMPR